MVRSRDDCRMSQCSAFLDMAEGLLFRNFPASSRLYLTAPVISTSDTSVGPGLGATIPAARVSLRRAQAGGSSESEPVVCGIWLHAFLTKVSRVFLSRFTQAADHSHSERSPGSFSL